MRLGGLLSLVLVLGLTANAGCAQESTGVAVQAHMVGAPYDELRFGVFLSPPPSWYDPEPTLVDPDTQGRMKGPFGPGNPGQVFFFKEDLPQKSVRCDVVALAKGVVTARGDRLAKIDASAIKVVDVFLSPAVNPSDPTMPPTALPRPDPGQVINDRAVGGPPIIAAPPPATPIE